MSAEEMENGRDSTDQVEKIKFILRDMISSRKRFENGPPPVLDHQAVIPESTDDVTLSGSVENLLVEELKIRQTLIDFINKFLQIIVRAREVFAAGSKTQSIKKWSLSLVEDDGFWKNAVPLHLDVCSLGNENVLLERWVIAFQPDHCNRHNSSLSHESGLERSTTSLSDVSGGALSPAITPVPSPPRNGEKCKLQTDTTNLILLAQSLYSHIRLLPLHGSIQEAKQSNIALKKECGVCFKTYLASPDGLILDPGSDSPTSLERSFDSFAKLKFYKFPPAVFSHGQVHLSVVYDTNGGKSVSSRCRCGVHSKSRGVPEPVVTANESHFEDDGAGTPRRPPSASSPFPSPSMQRKVLNIAQLKLAKCGKASSTVSSSARAISSIRRASGGDEHYESSGSPLKQLFHSLAPSGNNFSHVRIPAKTLVGSYEDSLWHARMSKLPSKPIEFFAEIGVVGLGKCPTRLRCPSHVNVPFPAWYYDLDEEATPTTPYAGFLHVPKSKRAELGLKSAGYRIPPKGQLQIIVKNQSGTAIKLFLVPYDLTDMPVNSRMHTRQKHYSSSGVGAQHRHLRYAIHLQCVCLSSSFRHYLSPRMRLIFCQRNLDLGEKLDTVTETLLPKYSSLSQSHSLDGSASNLAVSETESCDNVESCSIPYSSIPLYSQL